MREHGVFVWCNPGRVGPIDLSMNRLVAACLFSLLLAFGPGWVAAPRCDGGYGAGAQAQGYKCCCCGEDGCGGECPCCKRAERPADPVPMPRAVSLPQVWLLAMSPEPEYPSAATWPGRAGVCSGAGERRENVRRRQAALCVWRT